MGERFLSEKKVKKLQQERALRPYKKGATKVGRGIFAVGKGIADGLNYLGREGQKSHKPKQSRPSSYESKLRSTLTKAQKIKVAREKRRVKKEKALKKRLS